MAWHVRRRLAATSKRPLVPRTGSSAAGTARTLTTPQGQSGPSTPAADRIPVTESNLSLSRTRADIRRCVLIWSFASAGGGRAGPQHGGVGRPAAVVLDHLLRPGRHIGPQVTGGGQGAIGIEPVGGQIVDHFAGGNDLPKILAFGGCRHRRAGAGDHVA